ncbi:unnamed protein product (mitochondrion) [Plasmodiophora brassicae]|uniref:Uncharacterized protein n=1 Tax=Plasmodiophora brassicae TaxID=37360 RepID=A0A3P3Y146_PLABS|nr:unnamed protein product [Plasmodiophora brassicae]
MASEPDDAVRWREARDSVRSSLAASLAPPPGTNVLDALRSFRVDRWRHDAQLSPLSAAIVIDALWFNPASVCMGTHAPRLSSKLHRRCPIVIPGAVLSAACPSDHQRAFFLSIQCRSCEIIVLVWNLSTLMRMKFEN